MRISDWSSDVCSSDLPWPGINYFCTTRQGGVSTGPWASFNLGAHAGDEHDAVNNNRQRLRAMLPGDPVWLKQVHGAEVFDADEVAMQGPVNDLPVARSEEHTYELQSLMRSSYAVFCWK